MNPNETDPSTDESTAYFLAEQERLEQEIATRFGFSRREINGLTNHIKCLQSTAIECLARHAVAMAVVDGIVISKPSDLYKRMTAIALLFYRACEIKEEVSDDHI